MEPRLREFNTLRNFKFYINASYDFRFPFYHPTNHYRLNGLFTDLEDVLCECGEKFRRDYGENFLSINMRGSWIRGIPTRGDDIDVLFIIQELPDEEKRRITETTRRILRQRDGEFITCEGKWEDDVKVEPISFLDFAEAGTILNSFMYGLKQLHLSPALRTKDHDMDAFMGSHMTKKILTFLKSGILIPYVGWIYGLEKKKTVFDCLDQYLPIPTTKTALYSAEEIDYTKELIRQTFIARNLIFPSIKLRRYVDLDWSDSPGLKEEALSLYRMIEPLERIHARAVINYVCTARFEEKYFGIRTVKERIDKFAANYDLMVDYVLTRIPHSLPLHADRETRS
jgi:hypothetical protein